MDKMISGGKLKERACCNSLGVRGTNDALLLVQHMQGLNGNIASELSSHVHFCQQPLLRLD